MGEAVAAAAAAELQYTQCEEAQHTVRLKSTVTRYHYLVLMDCTQPFALNTIGDAAAPQPRMPWATDTHTCGQD